MKESRSMMIQVWAGRRFVFPGHVLGGGEVGMMEREREREDDG